MKKAFQLIVFITVICSFSIAHAVTVRNTCTFPIAGSLIQKSTGVPLYQFRLVPDQKVHMKKSLPQETLILRVIPDIRDVKLLKTVQKELDTPDCYVILRVKNGKLDIKVD